MNSDIVGLFIEMVISIIHGILITKKIGQLNFQTQDILTLSEDPMKYSIGLFK